MTYHISLKPQKHADSEWVGCVSNFKKTKFNYYFLQISPSFATSQLTLSISTATCWICACHLVLNNIQRPYFCCVSAIFRRWPRVVETNKTKQKKLTFCSKQSSTGLIFLLLHTLHNDTNLFGVEINLPILLQLYINHIKFLSPCIMQSKGWKLRNSMSFSHANWIYPFCLNKQTDDVQTCTMQSRCVHFPSRIIKYLVKGTGTRDPFQKSFS